MHASWTGSPRAIAPWLVSLLLALAGCGGGGGGDPAPADPSGGGGASPPLGAGPSSGGTGSSSGTDPAGGDAEPPGAIAETDGPETLQGTAGDDVLLARGGDDRLEGGAGNDRMLGGPGNDTYVVTDAGDVVVERPGEGIDEVRTSVSFQLPPDVENLSAMEPSSASVLTGNALPNRITGSPWVYEQIFGLDGDDVLDGGGRHGAALDGGNGNDRLVNSFGEATGGPGADTFVAAGQGAMTSPDAPITVLDFNGAEGDRIEIYAAEAYSSADLFARGILRFEPETGRLVLDFDPGTTAPTSVNQVFILRGVQAFDPSWVSFTVPPR